MDLIKKEQTDGRLVAMTETALLVDNEGPTSRGPLQ
jgi:hypothetical protein